MSGPVGLQRFVRSGSAGPALQDRPAPAQFPGTQAAPERCELCATQVPAEHGHVADLDSSSLRCACRACYLLFTQAAAGQGRYRAVPDRYRSDPGRVMSTAEFDELQIPVGLAFFVRSTRGDSGLSCFYPGPAGVTQCQLDLLVWQDLQARYPLLAAPAAAVEAALISSIEAAVEYFLVPVDACYELAGRMRQTWRGFDGGSEAKSAIAAFLARVRQRARPYAGDQPGRDDQWPS